MWKFKIFRQQEFIQLIKFLIDMYNPDTYVEVGVQNSYTFDKIAPLVKKAIGIDNAFLDTIINRAPNIILYGQDSLTVAKHWREGIIDLLFIDADHKKESVLADVDAFLPYVRNSTGLILLHDTYPSAEYMLSDGYSSNAWEAAREIHRNQKYKDIEIVTLPGPYAGISILRKSEKHLHWRD